MKRIALFILAVAGMLVTLVLYHVGEGFVDAARHGGSPEARERRLVEIAKETNQGLPKQAGELTRVEKAIAGPGLRFTYVYRFPNQSQAEVDPAKLEAVARSKAIEAYKRPTMADFRKWEVELCYQYVDKDGNEIVTVSVSPRDL
jgi:hypothetical protein